MLRLLPIAPPPIALPALAPPPIALLPIALLLAACAPGDEPTEPEPDPTPFSALVVTFNTGTSEGMGHDAGPDDGYTEEHAAHSDTWYGDGLAWLPAVEAATAFFADVAPDVVAFQEIFYSQLCADIPPEAHEDFVCADWQPGDATVANRILGEGYQVACHPGKDDKCAAVRTDFGRFEGCEEAFCLEGLDGFSVDGCGNGARVGRGTIQLAEGGTLNLVNMHGSSGLAGDDMDCRVLQVDQVFVDLGDGEPGARGARSLILGDFNTDPGRWETYDESAARWLDFAAPPGEDADGRGFRFHTEVGDDAPPTYSSLANIDHVITDFAAGSCWHAGTTAGHAEVTDARYFDHQPAVCALEF